MSNKRKKNRNKIAALNLSEAGDTDSFAIVSREIQPLESQAEQSGLLARLKAHWLIVGIIAFLALGALGAGFKYLEEDARRQMLDGTLKTSDGNNQSLLNRINPFLPAAPVVNSTHQLSKSYIYAGDRLLAVEDANATAVPPADVAVWRPSTGGWYVMGAGGVMRAAVGWGLSGDRAAAGDYDGDGKTDFCVFRPSETKWYILRSSNGYIDGVTSGASNDIPAPADYDGDGKTDLTGFRPSDGKWYITRSSNPSIVDAPAFGLSTDERIPADYDGDGKADLTVWRDSTKSFYRLKSDNTTETVSFASSPYNLATSDQDPVSADYDGDGRADFAVRDGGNWIILKSSNGQVQITNWGLFTDKAVPNDFDADGKADPAVFRDGAWYISNSTTGTQIENWGQAGDIPVPVFYRR